MKCLGVILKSLVLCSHSISLGLLVCGEAEEPLLYLLTVTHSVFQVRPGVTTDHLGTTGGRLGWSGRFF